MKWTAWKIGLVVLVITTVIGIAEAMQVAARWSCRGLARSHASSTMPSWYVLALLLPPTFWLARRFRFDDGGWRTALPIHLVASIAFTAVHLAVSTWISDLRVESGSAPALPVQHVPIGHPVLRA